MSAEIASATIWLGLAGALIAAGVAAADPAQGFSFRRAAFMPERAAHSAADAFVATRLPAGLPLAEAVARLERAELRCGAGATDRVAGRIACERVMPAYTDTGNLGEDVWTVQLTPGPNGTLARAMVRHVVVGSWPQHVR